MNLSKRSHKHYLRHNIREALRKAEAAQPLSRSREVWLAHLTHLMVEYSSGLGYWDQFNFSVALRYLKLRIV